MHKKTFFFSFRFSSPKIVPQFFHTTQHQSDLFIFRDLISTILITGDMPYSRHCYDRGNKSAPTHVADIWWKAEDNVAEEKLKGTQLLLLYHCRSGRQRRMYGDMSVQQFQAGRNERHCTGVLSWVGILSKSAVVDITWSKVHTKKERGAITEVEAK